MPRVSIAPVPRRRWIGLFSTLLALANPDPRALAQSPQVPATFAQLEARALNNTADDKLALAIAYDLGEIVPRNTTSAAEWYGQAAALGSREAELRLGMFAESGEGGLAQSYAVARQHYERALELGLPEANLRLGVLYLEGWGVPRDPAEAVARIRRAAEGDYRPAQRVLSDMYAVGIGTKADRQEALAWAQRAAREADAGAQVSVGTLLLKRLSTGEDLKLAREWYQLSVEQEYTRGMLGMAATFFRRGLTTEDRAIGRGWLKLAAGGGNTAAAFYLAGQMLLDPTAGGDEPAARTLLEQAAAAGEHPAREVLELASSGRSLADAFKYVISVPPTARYVAKQEAMRDVQAVKSDPTSRRSWRFSPGVRNGQVVNTRMRVPVYFTLSDVRQAKTPANPAGEAPSSPTR